MVEKSTWSQEKSRNHYPQISENLKADVVIIGAGITGVISAYVLSKAGKNVVMLEKDELGNGATELTTAFLTQSIDTDFTDLIKVFGLEKAQLIVGSHKQAIDLIEKIITDEQIECDFMRCSDYVYANSEEDLDALQEEYEAAKELGIEAVFEKDGKGLGFKNSGYIEIKNQAKFHPIKFIETLVEKMIVHGVRIFEQSEVLDITSTHGAAEVRTPSHIVSAPWALVTTYEPFNKPLKLYFKKAFYTSYVFEIQIKDMELQEGMYEDTENPYHYLRIDKEKKEYRVIIGGEDHRSDLHVSATKSFNALKEYLDSIIPPKNYTLKKQWSGPILEPVDGLAYIGPLDQENILYAMAFSGNGMTYAGIASLLFKDYVLNKENPLKEIYATKRIPSLKSLMQKGKDYSEELVEGAVKNTFTQDKKPIKKKK